MSDDPFGFGALLGKRGRELEAARAERLERSREWRELCEADPWWKQADADLLGEKSRPTPATKPGLYTQPLGFNEPIVEFRGPKGECRMPLRMVFSTYAVPIEERTGLARGDVDQIAIREFQRAPIELQMELAFQHPRLIPYLRGGQN